MDGAAKVELSAAQYALLDKIKSDPEAATHDVIRYFLDAQHLAHKQDRTIRRLETELAKLEEERRLDRARRFGASSEAGDHQANLFDEAEFTAPEDADTDVDAVADDIVVVTEHTKRRPKRKPLPEELPRVHVQHDLAEDEKTCGCCGEPMTVIGEKTAEQLEVIPMQAYVTVHHRPTYSCSACDESINTAPMPAQPIAKSLAGPGLLAHVATAKYADGLPLYRQAKQFERLGIELKRNTLASHMVKLGELIEPVIERLTEHIVSHDLVQMDETPVQVLKEPGKVAKSKSYMWVMQGGPPQHPAIVYHYDPTRAQGVPKRLLGDYRGYLQCDGYAGYNGILAKDGVTGVGCWAHVRRKFMDAKKALPKAAKGNKVHQALAFIGKLYGIEQASRALTPDERQRKRQADALPILERFKGWLDRQSVPPQTALGKAIRYALAEWPRLTVYIADGRIPIDNNLVENAIRPFAVGRKNWLFSDTQAGAAASARLYSLIETAKANGLNDYGYLKYLFTQLPAAQTDGAIDDLLPWRVDRSVIEQQLAKPSQHVVR